MADPAPIETVSLTVFTWTVGLLIGALMSLGGAMVKMFFWVTERDSRNAAALEKLRDRADAREDKVGTDYKAADSKIETAVREVMVGVETVKKELVDRHNGQIELKREVESVKINQQAFELRTAQQHSEVLTQLTKLYSAVMSSRRIG